MNQRFYENLEFVLLQRKGGKTSAEIMEKLLVRPYNPNQIAKKLNISYNTARYHLHIMTKFNLLEKKPTRYGTYYYAKKTLINEREVFEEIKKLI